MTDFVLVPGSFTAAWVWRDVADLLTEAGASAHPVTLAGMGPDAAATATPVATAPEDAATQDAAPAPGAAGIDLETHVAQLVALIDRLDAEDLVLVGHDYGILPVLAAAARRPGRVTRVVNVDTAPPQDGAPALAAEPDPSIRELALFVAATGGTVGPPAAEAWQVRGSVAGLPEEARDRLVREAVPQPVGTLVQPLRLVAVADGEPVSGGAESGPASGGADGEPVSGGAAAVPLTGVLCTANGSSIELVENLLGMGEPKFQSFTEPGVTFFELGTGHWPMLSAPEELADVLLRAAAGEGHRIRARRPPHLDPFLFEVPERERERAGAVDLYLPDAIRPRPAIVFVHGGPVPPNARPTPRDWPAFVAYGRHVADLGAVGVTVDHRLHALTDYPRAAQDLADAVEQVRSHPGVDADRIALWFFSGGGLLSAPWLAEPPSWLRCVAGTYPVLAPLSNWNGVDPGFRPVEAVRAAGGLPIVLTRVELDYPESLAATEEFLAAASQAGVRPDVIDVPGAHHAFETIDRTETAREAVRRAVGKVLGHVEG